MTTTPEEFGQRGIPARGSIKFETQQDRSSETPGRLNKNALELDTAGQVLAAIGLSIAYLVLALWPQAPYEPTLSGTQIYVPYPLWSELEAGSLFVSRVEVFNGPIPGAAKDLFEILLTFLCWVAIFRSRWIVAGAIITMLLLPWELTGQWTPLRGFLLLSLAFVIPLHFLKAPFPPKLGIACILLGLLPFLTAMLPDVNVPRLFEDAHLSYRSVSLGKIKKNDQTKAQWHELTDAALNSEDPPSVASARAFAVAQYAYKSENPDAALAAVRQISRLDVPQNRFQKDLIENIERYAIAHGAAGPIAKADVRADARLKHWIAVGVFGLGVALVLMGPVANAIRTSIQDRAKRIEAARQQLNAATNPVGPVQRDGIEPPNRSNSMVNLDATVTLDQLYERLRFFLIASLSCLGAAVVFALVWHIFWRPPVAVNTGFELIGVPWDVARFANALGLASLDTDAEPFLAIVPFRVAQALVGGIAVVCFMKFKSKAPGLLLLIAATFIGPYSFLVVPPAPTYEIGKQDLDAAGRAVLATKLLPAQKTLIAEDVQTTMASFDGASPRHPNNLPEMKWINPEEAAFVLAQLAYLEDRPDEVFRLLDPFERAPALSVPYTMDRWMLMREWVGANGYTLTTEFEPSIPHVAHNKVRLVSQAASILAVIAGLAGVFLLFVFAHLVLRYRKLEALLKETQYGLPKTRKAWLPTGARTTLP